jgi:hypothetical protein
MLAGRGTRIRTLDLQYPKLPRYQAALYPDELERDVDTRLSPGQQGAETGLMPVEERMPDAVAGRNAIFLRGARDHFQHTLRQPPRRDDFGR